MPTATQSNHVIVKPAWNKEIPCIPHLGRITKTDLVFKDTAAAHPLPALFLVVSVTLANGQVHTYEQVLGTQYPHGDHSFEHTHNQITALMQLCRVTSWNELAGQPVQLLLGADDPETVYGFCDIEQQRFCHVQDGGVILFWDD